MYVYFSLINSVLTCEEFPELLNVEEMKENNLEYLCNKWEKTDLENGQFTLSYLYKNMCRCDRTANVAYVNYCDFNNYDCYNCGKPKMNAPPEGTRVYLQNSGSVDCVWTNSNSRGCELCTVEGYPNMYQWIPETPTDYGYQYKKDCIFALHRENGLLSDADVSKKIALIQEDSQIIFVENV